MSIFDEAVVVEIPRKASTGRKVKPFNPDILEFTKDLLNVEPGNARAVKLPAAQFEEVAREVRRAAAFLSYACTTEWDKKDTDARDTDGNSIQVPVVVGGKVTVRFRAWIPAKRESKTAEVSAQG